MLMVAGIDHRAITEVRVSRVPDDTDSDADLTSEPVLDEARS